MQGNVFFSGLSFVISKKALSNVRDDDDDEYFLLMMMMNCFGV